MDDFFMWIYGEGDPIMAVIKLVVIGMCLELFAVACAYLGGFK